VKKLLDRCSIVVHGEWDLRNFFFPVLFVLIVSMCTLLCIPGEKKYGEITVGSKSFAEQYIVGNIITLLLESHGFRVSERFGTGSMITRMGLLTGQIDIYAEYTGTAWTLYLKHKQVISDPEELFRRLQEEDRKKNHLLWLHRTSINNTYALAIRGHERGKYGHTLSSLARYVNEHPGQVRFGIAHEFYHRPDGFIEMMKTYRMKLDESRIVTMDIGLTFESISRGQIDVAMVYSTDGKLKKFDLLILEDDKNFFPIYNLCFVSREDVISRYPEIPKILKPISGLLENETMQKLNYQVEVVGKPSKLVADQFLRERGLIR
jgi:osmoprotectant transport system substrate-binding protein